MNKDPIPEIQSIESILDQTLYVAQYPQQFGPESNLPTYQITTEKQRKEQSEKPPIRGEVYVFKNQHDKNTSIDIRIYTTDKVEIINVINFIKQYLSQFEINHNTNVIIVIGEGSLRLSYQELQTILSDSKQAVEKIGNLPRTGEILTIDSHFDYVIKRLLEKPKFLIAYYEDPETAIKSLREEIKKSYREFSQLKAERLEELIQNLRQKLDRIKANIDPKKALEILSLTEEEIEERIQQLPAIPNDFYKPLIHFSEQSISAQIDPSNIISAESKNTDTPGDTWWHYYIRRGNNEIPYQKSLIISFLNGKYPFLENQAIEKGSDPITLIYIGNGKYIASNGRHRIIAAKLLGAKSICCQVYELPLPVNAGEKRKVNPNNLYHLNYLISEGKIKGHIEEIEENGDNFFYIIFYEPPNPIYLFKDPNLASSIISSEK
jgi:hypothetical protein